MSKPSRATERRYREAVMSEQEWRRMKAEAARRGLPARIMAGLVLRWWLEDPRDVPLVPMRDR